MNSQPKDRPSSNNHQPQRSEGRYQRPRSSSQKSPPQQNDPQKRSHSQQHPQQRRPSGQGSQYQRPRQQNGQHHSHHTKNHFTRDETLRRHLELLLIHIQARRKYFDNFHLVNDQQRAKHEREFSQTGEQLRRFEDNLTPQQRELVFKNTDQYLWDDTYSENHELDPDGVLEKNEGPYDDPHFSLQQKHRPQYKDDKEESSGSMDDYLLVKNAKNPAN
jgi:hypothetical protein